MLAFISRVQGPAFLSLFSVAKSEDKTFFWVQNVSSVISISRIEG